MAVIIVLVRVTLRVWHLAIDLAIIIRFAGS